MTDVTIKGGRTRENAVNLLAAADVLELPRSVVRVTTGGFIVPEDVAKKAGFDPEPSTVTTPGPSEPPPGDALPEGDREVKVQQTEATLSQPVPGDAPEPEAKSAKKTPAKKTAAKKTAASKE